MKALFLDFDGVINDYGDATDPRLMLRPEKVMMIDDIIKASPEPVFLVISSTWRVHQPVDSFKFWLRRLGCWHWKEMDMTKRIVSKRVETSKRVYTNTHFRGVEIQEWLDRHPEITGYLILDDDGDFFDHQVPFHVQTDNFTGINEQDVKKAIDILNEAAP